LNNTETMEQAWCPADSEAACSQGWDIFETDRDPESANQLVDGKPYGYRPFEIQRVDDLEIFTDDNAAHAFVRAEAQNGDPLALRALAFLQTYSPNEYAAVTATN